VLVACGGTGRLPVEGPGFAEELQPPLPMLPEFLDESCRGCVDQIFGFPCFVVQFAGSRIGSLSKISFLKSSAIVLPLCCIVVLAFEPCL
jgi:hypothetical protein